MNVTVSSLNLNLIRPCLLYCQEVVISVLMKLAGGCPSLSDQLNVDAFLEQARSYDKASSNPVGWYIRLVVFEWTWSCILLTDMVIMLWRWTHFLWFSFCVCVAGTLRRESCRTLCPWCEPARWTSGRGARSTGPYCKKCFGSQSICIWNGMK